MSYRTVVSIAAAAMIGIACVSTEALAYRGGVRVGGYHGGAYRGGYGRRGVGVGVGVGLGAAALGAAMVAPAIPTVSDAAITPTDPVLIWR